MRVLVLALVLASLGAVRADEPAPPGSEPIDPALLRGKTLWLESGNCSVETPRGYDWLTSRIDKHPEVEMFLCRSPERDQIFIFQVYNNNFGVLDAKGMAEFLHGAKGSMEQQGWSFQGEPSFSPAPLPVPDSSFRFSMKLSKQEGKQAIYWMGYVSTAQRMYVVSSMQPNDGETPAFNQFVRSFKLLKPVSSSTRGMAIFQLVVLSLIVGSVTGVVATKRNRAAEKAAAASKPIQPAEAADSDVDEEDDETDAFKPKPIVPVKSKETPRAAKPAVEKARDKPTKPAAKPQKSKPDENRPRRNDRPFG